MCKVTKKTAEGSPLWCLYCINFEKIAVNFGNEIVFVSLMLTLNIVLISDLALEFLMLTLNRYRNCLLGVIRIVFNKIQEELTYSNPLKHASMFAYQGAEYFGSTNSVYQIN